MQKLIQQIFQTKEFLSLAEESKKISAGDVLNLNNAAGSILAFVAAKIFIDEKRQIVLIASDEDKAEKLWDDCALLVGETSVRLFGARPTHQAQMLDMTSSITQIETLKSLVSQNTVIVVVSPQSIIEKVSPPQKFLQSVIELKVNEEYNFQTFLERLQELGFEKKDFVESYGNVAVRGGIVDVFPYIGENPIRLEFWGNTVESIREFDVLSQRSIRQLEKVSIVPSLTTAEDLTDVNSATLFNYLHQEAIIILDEPALVEKEIEALHNEGTANLLTFQEITESLRNFRLIVNTNFDNAKRDLEEHVTLNFDSRSQPSFNGSVKSLVRSMKKFSSLGFTTYLCCDTQEEADRLKELLEDAITSPSENLDGDLPLMSGVFITVQQKGLQSESADIRYEIITETVHSGFLYPSAKLAILTEHEIFGRLKRRTLPKRRRFKGFSQKELHQIHRGDFVVHVDHGVGSFAGLTKITVGGVEQEVMKLVFLENDVLYVNLNFVNRVQKYSSQEGHAPRLSKLGTPEWERAKARAKKRIKDIARDLIRLYAKRKHEKGFAFSPDSSWQKELEASFMYEDTPDQVAATLDVKRDMESSSPMDRLICGDVGFGKTEVAVRAAFKAVMNGKQVAVLVPTTILAIQHANTFQDRLSRYTTRIEHLTRFKSKKEQKEIIEGLKNGSVDIIIGTHRLLSKDIELNDLGLLIIDEEHRFGVTAKEKLRQLKAIVDTLTLTATPIPRTLHFSLMGARDLSLIATPPRNRLPIVTEIIPASEGRHGDSPAVSRQAHWQVIRESILKELHRGGQIYFVHDRVHNINEIAQQVKAHVPEARVHIAHGQMAGHELEKTMLDFLDKKYDVLVCTKIIESGLDIPNVNTIIVNRADRFGLAELYQLRGRVGRSNVQAYAYLLVPPLSILPKQTLRRLQAIEEFTELGSGFNLAMRDLEIRGAGNILGAEQSGFIMEMGFEMYERIVREAVEELKQEEFTGLFQDSGFTSQATSSQTSNLEPQTTIDSDIEAFVPDFYIESGAERLDIYRRLYRAVHEEELTMMRNELQDRFGEYPEEVEHLFKLVELRLMGSQANFPKLSLKENLIVITLPDDSDVSFYGTTENPASPFQCLMKNISEGVLKNVRLQQQGKVLTLLLTLPPSENQLQRLLLARERLKEIVTTTHVEYSSHTSN
jgi:transcription-repair coupling factor (superfamily II helicase)